MLAMMSNEFALLLCVLFCLAGLVRLVAPAGPGFSRVAGVAQLFAALFLAIPQTRIWGSVLAAAILFVTVVGLLNRGKYLHAVPAIILLALVPAAVVPL